MKEQKLLFHQTDKALLKVLHEKYNTQNFDLEVKYSTWCLLFNLVHVHAVKCITQGLLYYRGQPITILSLCFFIFHSIYSVVILNNMHCMCH